MNDISVQAILENLKIELNDEAKELLEQFKNDKNNYSSKFVKLLLTVDLNMIIKNGSFPKNIYSLHGINLKGVHLVQLLEAEDITKAKGKNRFYFNSNYNKIKNISINPPSKNRMLKLTFTDGKSICTAMEYKQLPELDEFINYWCNFVSELQNSNLNIKNIHILALLSGEPILRRGVILLLPGMLTFLKFEDGIKDQKKLTKNEVVKDKKKISKSIKDTVDIRSYSNFIISTNKKFEDESKFNAKPELSNAENHMKLNELKKNKVFKLDEIELKGDFCEIKKLSRPQSSSIVDITEDFENKKNLESIQDIEFIEAIENIQDENKIENIEFTKDALEDNLVNSYESNSFKDTYIDFSYEIHNNLNQYTQDEIIWVEAAVLNSKIDNNQDDIILEIGIHYPTTFSPPWNELIFNEIVLNKETADKIMFINVEYDYESYMDYLLTYSRFIQGNMCLKLVFDEKNRYSSNKIFLIGFVPHLSDSELLLSLIEVSENEIDEIENLLD